MTGVQTCALPISRGDRVDDVIQLLRRQILGTHVRFDVRLFENLFRGQIIFIWTRMSRLMGIAGWWAYIRTRGSKQVWRRAMAGIVIFG